MKASFIGTQVSITLNELNHISNPAANGVHYNVSIDGQPPTILVAQNGLRTYPLASGLPFGLHTVSVQQRTEVWVSDTRFQGFSFGTGQLVAPSSQTNRKILIIGDSISAGANMEGTSPCVSSRDTNAGNSYGSLTAANLDADATLLAISGGMMISAPNGDSLPKFYPYTLIDDRSTVWDSSQFIPQAIVINLGTNDIGMHPSAAVFEGAYNAFLATLRSEFPDAHIFCAVGPTLQDNELSTIRKYVKEVVAQANSPLVHYVEFEPEDFKTGSGCDGFHPNLITHQRMANVLTPAISTALGW
jgi:lysophospholipase L1-like esterase